jgi:hypothetical protein
MQEEKQLRNQNADQNEISVQSDASPAPPALLPCACLLAVRGASNTPRPQHGRLCLPLDMRAAKTSSAPLRQ